MSGEELSADSPGRVLATAREAIGVTQREVADALNLPIHIVAALETDELDKLPSPVFARGYMRAYAKLLEIDPEPLLASLRFAGGETAPPLTITRDPTTNTPGISPRTLTIGAMALVAVLFLIMVFSVFDDETASDDTPDREVAEEAEVPDAGASDEVTTLAPDPQAAAADDLIPVLEPSEDVPTSAASVAQAGAEPAEVDLPGLRRLMPDGDDRLSLKFTEECWVEIKNPQGRVLYGGLGTPGQTLDFVGRGPFHILLGYAPGASLRFNFETVALAPHTRQDVASLVLGQ